MGNDCSVLQGNADPCQIAKCVKKLEGLPSNSASPTDTMIVHLKDCTNYKGVRIDRAFMKIWITRPVVEASRPEIEALNYEIHMYSRVVKPLIDSGVCPFFVKYIAGSLDCTYDNLFQLYKLAFPPETERSKIDRHVDRNLSYMLAMAQNRPAIQDESNLAVIRRAKPLQEEKLLNEKGQALDDKFHYRFAFLINEVVAGSETLLSFISKKDYADDEELMSVLLQVTYACQSLVLSKCSHMDLHLGNIFVQRLPKSVKTRMIYVHANGALSMIDFMMTCKVFLYDFDHSYTPFLGPNPLLKENRLRKYNMTNELIENRDIIKVLGAILHRFSVVGKDPSKPNNISLDVMRKIRYAISSSRYVQDALKILFATKDHFMVLPNGEPAGRNMFAEFNSTQHILIELMSKVKRIVFDVPQLKVRLEEDAFDTITGQLKRF